MIRRSMADILARARAELAANPTITTYIMLDDYEWRGPGDPLAGLSRSFGSLGAKIFDLAKSYEQLSETLRQAQSYEQLSETLRQAQGGWDL